MVEFWNKSQTIEKLRKKYQNDKCQKFYFLDGPPYTSGKFHLGHAWNYALKDFVVRYKRSQGMNVWDRNGFDMHGLPTEHKVMEKFGLKTKEDIFKFGLDKFNQECEKFSREMAGLMTKDLVRWGISLDTSRPYMPITPEFIEGEWSLIKKAYDQDRVYYGEKVLTWCQHCETAVAKHECEYKNVKEDSIFLKFPVIGKNEKAGKNEKTEKKGKSSKNKEFLIVWTTTPWTIPFNLAVMVNPEIDYVKADVGGGEVWILAEALANVVVQVVAGKKIKILEKFKGDKLEGMEYRHPFEKMLPIYAELKKKHKKVHTVILSEQFVDTGAGSGLVHSAPGCGPEDQEACKPYKIPPFNTLSEQGFFPEEMGPFAGYRAKVDDKKFVKALEDTGSLIAVTDVEHEYPFCWRCHKPVVFRITYQWFFKIEDLRDKIIKGDAKVHWVPESSQNSYQSWVRNLKDNSISRQRYWGTPLPIWKCTDKKCPEIKVIGTRADIVKNGGIVPESAPGTPNLHIPWIDAVELKCQCGKSMKRVPDVIDVWVDSGTTSWNCLNNDPKLIKEWYPADCILEAKEQTRLWFSMLSICSYLMYGKISFKNVYTHGMLNDLNGVKMSKSLGNITSPYEIIDKYGVDVLRIYMCQNNAGKDINFSWDECATKSRNLQIIWNVHKLLISLATENQINPSKLDSAIIKNVLGLEEKYIFSRLNNTIKKVTELFDNYHLDEAILPLEEFYLELSRTYIQMIRDKSSIGDDQDKEVCVYTIYHCLMEFLKMFNIIAPFISETIYQNLREEFQLKEESLTNYLWPKSEERWIHPEFEEEVEISKWIIQSALAAREKAKLGLRWPIKSLIVESKNSAVLIALKKMEEIVKKQTNVKAISLVDRMSEVKLKIRPDFSKIGPIYGELSPQILAKLTIDSPQTILKHIEEDNFYQFRLEDSKTRETKEVKITKEMLIVERAVPEKYKDAEFKYGYIYLDLERNEELEAEGYARELMRSVQDLRKKAGLEKKDDISLVVKCDQKMKSWLEKFKSEIEEKVGAEKMVVSTTAPVKKYFNSADIEIKGQKLWMGLEKI